LLVFFSPFLHQRAAGLLKNRDCLAQGDFAPLDLEAQPHPQRMEKLQLLIFGMPLRTRVPVGPRCRIVAVVLFLVVVSKSCWHANVHS
jgi:hypothetical protein